MMLSSGVVAVFVDAKITTPLSACGHRCEISPVLGSSLVIGSAAPPATGHRESPPRRSGATTMNPSGPQLGPRPLATSQIGAGDPPSSDTFQILPCRENPTQRLSGEKNGLSASSVPAMVRDAF